MGFILFIIACLLFYMLSGPFVLWALFSFRSFKACSDYFHNVAFAIDQLGNVLGAPMMNACLLKKEPAKLYGNPDETISHVTGVNYQAKKLTWVGLFVAKSLNFVDKNHVEEAAINEQ